MLMVFGDKTYTPQGKRKAEPSQYCVCDHLNLLLQTPPVKRQCLVPLKTRTTASIKTKQNIKWLYNITFYLVRTWYCGYVFASLSLYDLTLPRRRLPHHSRRGKRRWLLPVYPRARNRGPCPYRCARCCVCLEFIKIWSPRSGLKWVSVRRSVPG